MAVDSEGQCLHVRQVDDSLEGEPRIIRCLDCGGHLESRGMREHLIPPAMMASLALSTKRTFKQRFLSLFGGTDG